MEETEKKHSASYQKYLVFLCWFIYTMANVARYSYSANVTLIEEKYGVSHAVAGLPATFYFFAYGLGQILTGALCKKYNVRYVVTGALLVSAGCNFLLFCQIDFTYVKYIWAINGLAQSNFWPLLMLTLGRNIDEEYRSGTGIVMSTATAGGTFLSYGISALFAVRKEFFHYTFLVSSVLLPVIGLLWFFSSKNLKKSVASEKIVASEVQTKKKKVSWSTIVLLGVFAEFSMMSLAISGGLRQWVPAILKDSYGLEDWMSIFVSVLLPLFSIFASFISAFLYRKVKDFSLVVGLMFAVSVVLCGALTALLQVSWGIVMVVFVLLMLAMGVIQNQMTVIAPLSMQEKANSGFLAGFLNGCSYIGNALSTYGLGLIADHSGWLGVFLLLTGISIVSAAFAFAYYFIYNKRNRVHGCVERENVEEKHA